MKITPKEDFIIDDEAILSALGGKIDLLPCPFCGKDWVVITGRINRETNNVVLTVNCMRGVLDCGASMVTCVKNTAEEISKGKEELKNRWNKRSNESKK